MKYCSKQHITLKDYIFWVGLIFFIFFYPTSKNGVQLIETNAIFTYIYYGTALGICIFYLFRNNISFNRIVPMFMLLVYLFLGTIVAYFSVDGEFKIARFLSVLFLVIILSIDDVPRFSKQFVVSTLEIITVVLIIWNIGLISNVPFISKITIDYYSQFNDLTTKVFADLSRPVFTFGVYSYGAFFYAGIFMLWYIVVMYLNNNKMRFYLYMIILIAFQFLLRGSIALALGVFMLFVFLKSFGKSKARYLLVPLFAIAGIYFIYTMDYDWTRIILGNQSNGFYSRYMTTLFDNNVQAVKDTIVGVGYSSVGLYNVSYTDSGYIVLFTMGNIIMPIVLYYSLFKKFKYNTPRGIYMLLYIMFLMFEVALPGLLYPKLSIFICYLIVSIKTVVDKEDILQNEKDKYVVIRGSL